MRVAIDTNALYTGQAGTARHVRGFLRGLQSLPDPVDFFQIAWEVENLGYQQPARSVKTLYRELVWARTIAPRELIRRGADLYHATGSYFVHPPKGMKCVATLHDLSVLRTPERFRRWTRWSEPRRLARLARVDRVICISRFTANEAMELLRLPSRLLEVVYNGCEFHPSEPPKPEEKPDFEVPPEYFLFVGSLEPGKNLSLIRQSYALAADRGESLPPLLVVGVRWAGVAGEGAPPAGWSYLGRQPDGVLQYLYRRALALVFPTRYEGFGLTIAEAMALGCPVICSRVASLPEVGGDAACYTELTPVGYLDAMRRIAADPSLRSDLVAKGYEQSRRFSWTQFAQSTVDIYRDVMRG
jgi:alpha-1,3-rhamnosyl/mannosyltransferase